MSTIFDRYSVSYSGGSAPASSESAMVLPHRTAELLEADEAQSFVHKLQLSVSKGLPHAVPVPGLRTEEHELVKAVFQVLQGFETSWLYWDSNVPRYREKAGIYVAHLSLTGLRSLLSPFLFTATCLKQVELFVGKVRMRRHEIPTLDAFASSVDSWLKRLREAALKEEEKLFVSDNRTITLLGLTDSLSSLRSGAEHLSQVLHGAVPDGFWDSDAHIASSEVAVHILDHLFKKLNEVCLLEDGEGEPFHMLLVIFTGSLLPYLQCLDSWIYDGILDDPYEEMFFYANNAVTIDQPAFWEMSYMLRVRGSRVDSSTTLTDSESIKKKESSNHESITAGACLKVNNQGCVDILCPVFLKDIARAIVSAGKSFQLVQHVQDVHQIQTHKGTHGSNFYQDTNCSGQQKFWPDMSSLRIHDDHPRNKDALEVSTSQFGNDSREMGLLTLSEIFLICLSGLLENGDHVYEYLRTLHVDRNDNALMENGSKSNLKETEDTCAGKITEKTWVKLLKDATSGRKCDGMEKTINVVMEKTVFAPGCPKDASSNAVEGFFTLSCYENPAVTACREVLLRNPTSWSELNISESFHLPPLDDGNMRRAIFADGHSAGTSTDYKFGFQFNDLEYVRQEDERRTLEDLYAFPTLLPCAKENALLSEILPMQKDSALASRVLKFIQNMSVKDPLQPVGIIQECLSKCIKRQVDHIGNQILSKLMGEWRLMDELLVLRAIYLLGSGDMLQQFLITIFDKLDRGNSWDDDFELNNLLQESIRNSADKMLLTAPDSLVVSLAKHDTHNGEEGPSTSKKGRALGFGIDALDMLNFTYKVSWPLDLIVNTEALKKYNQVMGFLLKVKRAKFVLDETRKWMWKARGRTAHNFKQHLIVAQKLLHFVDAFHQFIIVHGLSFVMAWRLLLHWMKSWKFMRHISLLSNDNALWPLISCGLSLPVELRLFLDWHWTFTMLNKLSVLVG
ncbi:hypothetical protein BDA96_02G389500 [Sorghum bicolor]|uniref:Gamma-tubulin complex component n=2 Tax=Sorghum bicolor TaxID=4558 RepID=A0A1B6QFG4_SORBI|nr:hypothetical protein BDA96_02G389500 [Sorghum bicolor]KXG36667.1 hypothetical protein SORBI_3002G371600 [Sorghum bicolor]